MLCIEQEQDAQDSKMDFKRSCGKKPLCSSETKKVIPFNRHKMRTD